MKHSCSHLVIVVLLFVTHLAAGLALCGQTHGSSYPCTEAKRVEEWAPNTVYNSDKKTHSISPISFASTVLTELSVSIPIHKRNGNVDAKMILPPSISPVTSIAGVFLIISGLFSISVGTKNQRSQVFLSTTYLVGLGIAILILHLADPPVSLAIQGAYLVATLIPALVIGSLASLFKDVLEGIGSATGGFCLAMFIMTLHDGGLLQTIVSKTIFIICFTVGIYALSFNRHVQAYILVGSTSMTGATALILGIDCFSLAGLKEFWVYIWGINSRLFLESQATYEITRGMAVEMAGIALFTILGILFQKWFWKVVVQQRRYHIQVRHFRKHRQEDIESRITRIEEGTQCSEKQEMDHKYSSDQIGSHVFVGAVDEAKSIADADVDITDELHPVTMEAVQTACSKPVPLDDLDNTITQTDLVEPITLGTLCPTRTLSTSTTLASTIKTVDEPFPYFGKLSVIPQIKQTNQRQEDKRSTTASYRNRSSSQLRQLRPSETFMEIVATKLRRLSQITKIAIGTPVTNVDSQQSMSHQSSVENSQFDPLYIDEAQISQPLIEQESAEQFVSSFLEHPSRSAKIDESKGQILELQERRLGNDAHDENEVVTDRPPTRRGSISVTSKLPYGEELETRTQPLLRTKSTDAVPHQSTGLHGRTSTLVNTDLLFESSSKSRMPAKIESQAVLEHTLRTKSSQPASILGTVSSKPKVDRIEAEKSLRTFTIKSGHDTDPTMEKVKLTPAMTTLSNRSSLRSSIGTWPQHNTTKHSLQRRLQSSLRNSRSCVLTSPIDEDAVASFTFQPLIDNTDILRRASYPRRSRTGPSAGDSIRSTFGQSSVKGPGQQPFTNASSRENPYSSDNRQHSRRSLDGPTLSRRQQTYLESIQPDSRTQNQGQPRPKEHLIPRKLEQSKVPQHTLYRASMLAEWRRSNPMEPKGLERTPSTSSPNIPRKHLLEPETSTPVRRDSSSTNNHHSTSITHNRRMVGSTTYGSNHKILGSNVPESEEKAKSVPRRPSALTPREVYIHKEVLRCMQAGTYPVFEESNMF